MLMTVGAVMEISCRQSFLTAVIRHLEGCFSRRSPAKQTLLLRFLQFHRKAGLFRPLRHPLPIYGQLKPRRNRLYHRSNPMFCTSDFPTLSDRMSLRKREAFHLMAQELFFPSVCRRSMRVYPYFPLKSNV